MKHVLFLLYLLGLMACGYEQTTAKENMVTISMKELIVLAAPPDGDTYYTGVSYDIYKFHIAYAKQILKHDDVLIFTGKKAYEKYVRALGKDHVVLMEMQDIWMRDFSLSNPISPAMFSYTSEGQGGGRKGQREADFVQDVLVKKMKKAGLTFKKTRLLNDGGNFVDDGAGNVVVSRKFLRDNHLTETQGAQAIQDISDAKHIAFIEADEQGGLEHADGVVAFIDANTLVTNSYPTDPKYASDLRSDLKRSLPNVIIHEIITPYDGSKIYDKKFGSACGLYTNMLVTPSRIYFPQFGIPEDAQALAQIKRWTTKTIVPVISNQVCHMGGGVRCMSWQLRGSNADALREYVRTP